MCDGEDCCKTIAKILLVIINLFFFLLGLLMLAFGIAMVVAPDKVVNALTSIAELNDIMKILGNVEFIIKGAGIFMIVLGGIVAIIGGLGFFGACCENRVLLVLYLIAVIIILLAEVALIIFAACFPNAFMTQVQTQMNNTMIKNFTQDVQVNPNFTVGSDYEFGYSWAAIQFGAKCCGTYNSTDYQNQNRYTIDKRQVTSSLLNINQPVNYPISCCKLRAGVTLDNIKGANDFYDLQGCLTLFDPTSHVSAPSDSYNSQGCYDAVLKMIKQAAAVAIGIAAAIVGLEIIIIILGFILCCWLQKSKSLMV